jgi:hypothetical protein
MLILNSNVYSLYLSTSKNTSFFVNFVCLPITKELQQCTKIAVFWVVAPCSLVEEYQRFRGPCRLHHQGGDDGGSKDL